MEFTVCLEFVTFWCRCSLAPEPDNHYTGQQEFYCSPDWKCTFTVTKQCCFHPVKHQQLSWKPSREPARSKKSLQTHRKTNIKTQMTKRKRRPGWGERLRAPCYESAHVHGLCVNVASGAGNGVRGWTSSISDQTQNMFNWPEESKLLLTFKSSASSPPPPINWEECF